MIQVPRRTTVWKTEPQHDKYVLYFAPELIQFIKLRKKYKTFRFGLRYDYLKVGDEITIYENNKPDIVSQAQITAKTHTTFANIPLKVNGHEIYSNKEEQRRVLSGYYKYIGRDIIDSDAFLILEFKLI